MTERTDTERLDELTKLLARVVSLLQSFAFCRGWPEPGGSFLPPNWFDELQELREAINKAMEVDDG